MKPVRPTPAPQESLEELLRRDLDAWLATKELLARVARRK
jgi:hypothetical protein